MGDRVGGDDHPPAVDGEVNRDFPEPGSEVEDLRPGGSQPETLEGNRFVVFFVRFSRLRLPEPGDSPGDPGDFSVRETVYPGDPADGSAGFQGHVVRDPGGAFPAVFPDHVLDDPVALVPGKIHVQVGRVVPLRVQEPFEEKVGFQGFHLGDREAVGHDGIGHASPPAGDPGGARVFHHVPDDEEVIREPLFPDHRELPRDPALHHRGDAPVAPGGSPDDEPAEEREGIFVRVEAGKYRPAGGDFEPALVGDLPGVRDRLGAFGEAPLHVAPVFQPGIPGGEAVRGERGKGEILGRGAEEAVDSVLVGADEMDAVGGGRGKVVGAGEFEEGAAPFPGGKLDEQLPGSPPGGDGPKERDAVAQQDQSLRFEQGRGEGEEGIEVPGGDNPAEGAVAGRGFHQEQGPFPAGPDFRPDDRADAVPAGGFLEVDRAAEVVGVGEGEGVHSPGGRRLRQGFGGSHSPAQGVVGVGVQVNEIRAHGGSRARRRTRGCGRSPAPGTGTAGG